MRYLLLSVLAVFFLVSFVTNAESLSYGVGILIDKTFYETGDTIFIGVTGFLLENLAEDATIKLSITAPNGDRIWSEEYIIPDSGVLHTSVDTFSPVWGSGDYIVFARYYLNEGGFGYDNEGCWNSQGNKISKANCEATATFTLKTTAGTPESVAEPKTVTNATLPPGVKSPAPNFESFSDKGTWWVPGVGYTNDGFTIGELYANWDPSLDNEIQNPWDPGYIKIVSGDGKDMLLYYVTIDCSECTEPWEDRPQNYLMYDGKDRKFEPITSSILNWNDNIVENPNFSWSEDCSPLPVTVQPGIIDRIKVCFEIPKNSDHFKFIDSSLSYTYVIGILERPTISNTASKESQSGGGSSGGGCLIATAAFGSEMAPQVQFLRELRDNTVLQTESGTSFMTGFNQFYYSFSPVIADYERENPAFKEAVKITLTPLLTSLTLLQYVDINSESEMLGYGIGVILLNIGMYFVAPAVLLSVCIRKIHQKQG